ncbi:MAG: HAMP domain-containing histidine kinase [Ruminococcus sp.]|nr:HAMP domain-containing histidine kinase [Ruminococcus sp.]
MDTKLKNGRKNRALWTGLVLSFLAAALFTLMLPEFDRQAAAVYESSQNDMIEGEYFISSLLQCNYILYKNIMDKTDNKVYAYEELYLSEELRDAVGKAEQTDQDDETFGKVQTIAGKQADIGQLNSIRSMYAEQMRTQAAQSESMYTNDIGQKMDYYVLQKEAGTVLKNTAMPIEELLVTPDNAEDMVEDAVKKAGTDDYAYYVIMDYDAAGNLQNISVRGQDADKLLKLVQTLESGPKGVFLQGRDETETFALYDSETKEVEKMLTFRQQKPKNVTFIYAMTKPQIDNILNSDTDFLYFGDDIFQLQSANSYYFVGIQDIYMICLAGIFILTVLAAVCRPALLQGKEERKAYVEVIVAAVILGVAFSGELLVWFVRSMGTNVMLEWLNTCLPFNLHTGMEYDIARIIICFGVMTALFGLWYFCCLEVSDVFGGVRKFIRTRSLFYKWWNVICGTLKKGYEKLKAELFSVDLGKDMDKLLKKLLFINFCLLVTACLCWWVGIFIIAAYTLVLYWAFKKYIHKIQEQYAHLLQSTNSIAQGNLNNTFGEDFGIFASYKDELYKIQDGFKYAVEEEVKSQRMKTELITNVSHDLKTPLTAIITYIDLLGEEDITQEQRREYLATLERKSLRLKVLIEDLFEVSKATSGNVKFEPVSVDIAHLMRQVYLEYEDKMKEAGLQVRFAMPEEKVILSLDPQKTYRIFENLYINIIKYALQGTRVFITAQQTEKERKCGIHIELKNISAQEILANPQELSERFVRGDVSRNTEGSGLGLAIAKSFTELQGGSFRIETDADLFKVVLDW